MERDAAPWDIDFSMKTSSPQYPERGIALVVVLGFLVIISALAIAFFASVGTVATSSRTYAAGVSTNMLSDTAVQLVESQIRTATTPVSATSRPAWVSQPGLLTVFGKAQQKTTGSVTSGEITADPGILAYFKLYSSDSMVLDTPDEITGFARAPANEYSGFGVDGNAPLFTDLNAPVLVPDPLGLVQDQSGAPCHLDYPIMDPSAIGAVEGFTIPKQPPGLQGTVPTNSAAAQRYNPFTSGTGNIAPMPVRWLYVLRDGTILAPDKTVKAPNVAQFNPVPSLTSSSSPKSVAPTKDNPIVGRIAFWTDDETCKVNINTAGEGTFWDTPMSSSVPEKNFGQYQAWANEFQRYPGHPATVCLSPILGSAFNEVSTSPAGRTMIDANPIPASFKRFIYKLMPRVTDSGPNGQSAGSLEGTVAIPDPGAGPPPKVSLDYDRLFASVDEYFFNPQRKNSDSAVLSINGLHRSGTSWNQVMRQSRFFLTASSRAPELNLFGMPRVSIWPVNYSSNLRTTKDKTFAFCSTIGTQTTPSATTSTGSPSGPYPFYFSRSRAYDAKDQGWDFNHIVRNQTVYDYLRYLMANPVPGYGRDPFTTKYPKPDYTAINQTPALESDQILTEIFDYIRCTNLLDSSQGATSFTPKNALPGGADFSGQVTPILIPGRDGRTAQTQGFGRMATITEAAVLFECAKPTGNEPAGTLPIEATMVFEMFVPEYGLPGYEDTYTIQVDVLDPFTLDPTGNNNPQALVFPSTAYNVVNVDTFNGAYGRIYGGYEGFGHTLRYGRSSATPKTVDNHFNTGTSIDSIHYPFVSNPVNVPKDSAGNTGNMNFYGGKIRVTIYPGNASSTKELPVSCQTLYFKMDPTTAGGRPATLVPAPYGYVAADASFGSFGERVLKKGGTYPAAIKGGPNSWESVVWLNDASRSMEAKVDPRLIAGLSTVGNQRDGSPGYFDLAGSPGDWTAPSIKRHIHSFRTSNGPRYANTALPAGVLATFSGGVPKYRYDTIPARAPAPASCGGPGIIDDPRMADVPYWSKARNGGAGGPVNGVERQEDANGAVVTAVRPTGIDNGRPGDWDTGFAKYCDGAYINHADEGNIKPTDAPYFTGDSNNIEDVSDTYFSPNRMIASAGWFGSLPTGVQRGLPYMTLLFRPDSATARSKHPGAGTIQAGINDLAHKRLPDHVIMDFFDMPVVEPYPISEPFSTAGKINLNFQIMPFGDYMVRDTALRALLRSEKVHLIPADAADGGHIEDYSKDPNDFRHEIDENTTLAYIARKWNNHDQSSDPGDWIYHSATQICECDLYPKNAKNAEGRNVGIGGLPSIGVATTVSQKTIDDAWYRWIGSGLVGISFWDTYRLTGDNVRERPYARLYSRLTTKSNTFTVHMRVQTLQKRASDPAQNTWDELHDVVTGEYRGSALIERYIDPADPRFGSSSTPVTIDPDIFTKNPQSSNPSLESAYKFRIVQMKQFSQ